MTRPYWRNWLQWLISNPHLQFNLVKPNQWQIFAHSAAGVNRYRLWLHVCSSRLNVIDKIHVYRSRLPLHKNAYLVNCPDTPHVWARIMLSLYVRKGTLLRNWNSSGMPGVIRADQLIQHFFDKKNCWNALCFYLKGYDLEAIFQNVWNFLTNETHWKWWTKRDPGNHLGTCTIVHQFFFLAR